MPLMGYDLYLVKNFAVGSTNEVGEAIPGAATTEEINMTIQPVRRARRLEDPGTYEEDTIKFYADPGSNIQGPEDVSCSQESQILYRDDWYKVTVLKPWDDGPKLIPHIYGEAVKIVGDLGATDADNPDTLLLSSGDELFLDNGESLLLVI